MGGFVIEVDDPRRDDVRRLLAQHRSFASGVMPPDGVHVLDPDEDASDGNVTLFSVRVDGELLGIGSLRQLNPVHAELKSMHTAIAARRRGVGRALLEHLVTVAATRGVRRVSLETGAGEAFEPARSLYASAGFVPCGPFGEYTATADNVFMTRLLGAGRPRPSRGHLWRFSDRLVAPGALDSALPAPRSARGHRRSREIIVVPGHERPALEADPRSDGPEPG